MGISFGSQAERSRQSCLFGRPQLQSLIIGGGDESCRIERIERQVCDAELVGLRRCRNDAGGGEGMRLRGVTALLEVPELD